MSSKISDKDRKDWEDFLSQNESLPDKDSSKVKKKLTKNITLDLHGFTLEEANEKVSDLIYYAYKNEVKKIIIVTGKGLHSENEKDPYVSKDLSILKHSVPAHIKTNNELMSMIKEIKEAEVNDGGSGAFYIFLKKKL